jgi:signal peptidase
MTALGSAPAAVVIDGPRRRARRRPALHVAGQLAAWCVMIGVGAVLLVAVVVPRLAGATPYIIETGSMTPSLPPGTLAVVRPVDPAGVRVGDVITFQLRSGDPTVVTHRVVAVGYDGTGQPRWHTQGDANGAVDDGWVRPRQLQGRVWYSVPYLGHAGALLDGDQRDLLVSLVALVLAAYAAVELHGAWVERRTPAGDRRAPSHGDVLHGR